MAIFRFTLLIASLLILFKANAQVIGIVYDAETNVPLKGAHIIGDTDITSSNINGVFKLPSENQQLIISHVGYITDTLRIKDIADIKIFLAPSYLRLDQVTVKGNLNQYPLLMVPSSITLIPKEHIALGNGISNMEILNQVPGLFVHSGTYSTTRITIRGIGSRTPYSTNRIKAYYNNIPLTSGDGSTEIEDIDVNSIDQIEILKGSKSALYGSGMGGVILMSSDKGLSTGNNAQADLSASSFGTYAIKAKADLNNTKFYLATDLSLINSAGWRLNSNYNRTNILLDAGYKGNKTQLSITMLFVDTKAGIPSSLNKAMFEHAPDSAAPNWLSVKGFEDYSKWILGTTIKNKLSSNVYNIATVFTNLYNGYESRPFNILDSDAIKIGFRDIVKIEARKVIIQTGIEMLYDQYIWKTFETNEGKQGILLNGFVEHRKPLSIFANFQYQFNNQGIVEVGISTNFLSYSLNDSEKNPEDLSGSYSYSPVYSPFIGINMPVNQQIKFYSSVSHGFSAPSVEETLMPDGAINPNLKPETGINSELGLRYFNTDKSIFLDACVYSLWAKNLLVTKRETEDVFYGANIGKTWHKGFEFSGSAALNKKSSIVHPLLHVNYNYIQATFTDFTDNEVKHDGNSLPGIPEHKLWLSLKLNAFKGFYFVPQYQFIGKQYLNDSNNESYDSYSLMHANIGYKRKWFDLSFGIKNLFDTHYASMLLVNASSFGGRLPRYYYPGMPRNFWLKLIIKL